MEHKLLMPAFFILSTGALNAQHVNNTSAAAAEEYEKVWGRPPGFEVREGERPNILLITSDQQVWEAIHCNDSRIRTPNLDRISEMGTVYDGAYTCNPVSTPTRCSIITGMFPSQHGAYALGTKLREDIPTIGNYFSEIGYSSYLVGKAHFMPLAGTPEFPTLEGYPVLHDLDFWKNYHGPFYGFEHVDLARNHGDEGHVGQHYALWMMEKLQREGRDPYEWKDWFQTPRNRYAVYNPDMNAVARKNQATNKSQYGAWNCPENYHLNAWIAETTQKRIDDALEKTGRPFFIWASFFDPHPPYLVPEPWASMYDSDEMVLPYVPEGDLDDMPYHYRMTQSEESGWGDVYIEDGFPVHGFSSHLKTARTPEQARRNKALYYGMVSMMDKYIGRILDHLEEKGLIEKTVIIFTTDHGNHIGSHGLHQKGGFLFQEDVRIPFLVAWKGHYPENRRSDALFSLVDLAPTLLSIAGMKNLPRTMAGKNARMLFEGRQECIRDHVIIENHFQRTKFYQKAYITKQYKLVWYMHNDEGELFDLENDPCEYHNLWDNPDYRELKYRLLHEAMQADMKKETCWMPRVGPA